MDDDDLQVSDFANLKLTSGIAVPYFILHRNGSWKEWGAATSKFLGNAVLRTPAAIKKELQEGDLLRRSRELIPLNANDFSYQPLPSPSSIRLLEVQPGGNSSTIECDLFVVDLKDKPKYTALSYSWRSESLFFSKWNSSAVDFKGIAKGAIRYGLGKNYDIIKNFKSYLSGEKQGVETEEDPEDTNPQPHAEKLEGVREILCNGQKMRVLPNLFNALAHLRRSHPGRYWIDQLCLNQTDEVEKGHQIQMMDRIFGSAQVVKVWLGACSPYLTNDVKDLLESPLRLEVDLKRESPRLVMACAYLLSSIWFERLWVLQETIVARDIWFQFGKHTFSSEVLIKTIEWFGHMTDINSEYEGEDAGSMTGIKIAYTLFPILYENITLIPALLRKRKEFQEGKRWSIFEWLEMSKARNATNVQDYVYAGLGVLHKETLLIDPDIVDDEPPPPLPPRHGTYSTLPDISHAIETSGWTLWPELRADIPGDIRTLFTNLAASVLSQPHGIDMLSFSQHDPKLEAKNPEREAIYHDLANLPSWIPTPRSRETPKTLTQLNSKQFQASTNFPNTAKISYDGTELHLDTAQLDTVKRVSSPTFGLLARAFRILKEDNKYVGPFDPTILQRIAYVLVIGMGDKEDLPPHEVLRAFLLCLDTECKQYVDYLPHLKREQQEGLDRAEEKLAKELQSSAAKRSEERRREIQDKYEKRVKRWEKKVKDTEEAIAMEDTLSRTLRTQFPDAPWPAPDRDVNVEESSLVRKYTEQFMAASALRSIFITNRGMIGLGPSWVREGDVVMLVKGGKVPYLFVPFDEHLKRDLERLKKRRDGIKEDIEKKENKKGIHKIIGEGFSASFEKELERTEREIKNREEQKGTNDAWWLVGEAYVEGVMNGEAAYPNEFKRISVL